MLVLGDVDLLDDAGDIGRDADLVGFDIGVVRRHHLAAGHVPIPAGDQRERQQQKQCLPYPVAERETAAHRAAGSGRSPCSMLIVLAGLRFSSLGASAVSGRMKLFSRRQASQASSTPECARPEDADYDGGNENPISIAFGSEGNSAMHRGDLADLSAFIAIADHLSFRAAASRLGVTPSALSHSMRQLEETPRDTSAASHNAQRIANRCRSSPCSSGCGRRSKQIADALEDLNRERSRPVGRLRIYATHMAAAAVIAPVWRTFLVDLPGGPPRAPGG